MVIRSPVWPVFKCLVSSGALVSERLCALIVMRNVGSVTSVGVKAGALLLPMLNERFLAAVCCQSCNGTCSGPAKHAHQTLVDNVGG